MKYIIFPYYYIFLPKVEAYPIHDSECEYDIINSVEKLGFYWEIIEKPSRNQAYKYAWERFYGTLLGFKEFIKFRYNR